MVEWNLEEIAPGVFARTGVHPLQPNSGIVVGERGVLVIDSGYSAAAGRELLADIGRMTPLPVTHVVISHHHFDHAWGNQVFDKAQVVGHSNARSNMLGETDPYKQRMIAFASTASQWYGLAADDLARQLAETRITPPNFSFDGQMTVDLSGQRVELIHFGAGHTTGDALVYLPDSKVLFGGDLICNHVLPNALDGDPLHWPDVLNQVDRLDIDIVVPGHGAVGPRSVVSDFRNCIDLLTVEVGRALNDGAPDPRSAGEQLHLDDFAGWAGRELLPGTVRATYRALEHSQRT
jgi:glyoxylase-like metal-dependent hydrolase (beta-lactamase superfamily II)